jgi:hypothetical protein
MLLGAVASMAIFAGVVASPASAVDPVVVGPVIAGIGTVPTQGYNALDANVPVLAWRGEHVRLGFCPTPDPTTHVRASIPTDSQVSWGAVDWSGDPSNGSVPVPFELVGARHFNNGCVYTEFMSEKAGVSFIKMQVNATTVAPEVASPNFVPGGATYVKQFIVAWMDMSAPVVTGGGTVDPGDICDPKYMDSLKVRDLRDPFALCDPTIDNRHRITATVTGNIPLLANYRSWATSLGTDHLTMPTDWLKFATVAARSSQPDRDTPQWITNWDIHDEITPAGPNVGAAEGHVVRPAQCLATDSNPLNTIDTGDNCVGTANLTSLISPLQPAGELGGFSTVLTNLSRAGHTVGPFDPVYTFDTMLSNGVVDAGDAPMPAAQIDVTIQENTGTAGDISGVGYLYQEWKGQDKSRDLKGTDVAHNLDQAFYSQYIPATDRPVDAAGSPYGAVQPTGITGLKGGTALPGFWWTPTDAYRNWDFAYNASLHPGTDSKCLNYQSYPSGEPTFRPLPYGKSDVTIYTDEHGQAETNFVPGLGFYFSNAGANSNGSCDLKGIAKLGTADVRIKARYPYQEVTDDPAAATVKYFVGNKFSKELSVHAKGPTPEDNLIRVILAHAQNIDGSPLSHEVVCWSASDVQNIKLFPGGENGGDVLGTNPVVHIDFHYAFYHSFRNSGGDLCTRTDDNGNTAVEVFSSKKNVADVMAFFENEQIARDTPVDFSVVPPTNTAQGALAGDTGPVTHVPSPQQVQKLLAGTTTVGPVLVDGKLTAIKSKVVKSHKLKKPIRTIRFARVYKPFHGKRSLQVRVNGKAGQTNLRITIKLDGKKKHTYVRTVPVNRMFSIKNLPIPAKTAKVTVSLLG